MKILILNWRDIKNPAGGGAEILTHEMAKRWVEMGHEVTQFSSTFPKSKSKEKIDNVIFKRRGKWWNVHIYAFFYYLRNKNDVDVIIDEVHWFPFFAFLYAPKKTIALTCEVAGKLLFRIFPYTIALIFLGLEKMYLQFYKTVPTMVISPSTYADLIATGHKKENVVILPMGITLPKKVKALKKDSSPTFISVGRLNIQKGTVDLIDAFSDIHNTIPNSKLWLVGSGEDAFMKALKEKIRVLHLEDAVILHGFVTEEEKFALLSRAHILMSASAQEGWGLTVPEAGLMKTPSVVYNIEGFRDIIEQNKTGILVSKNPKSLSEAVISLLKNKSKYLKMQDAVYKKSLQYSWDETAKVSSQFIKNHLS